MSFRLPPANTLRIFEAAARLESFKLAAQEIHVTPGAVSHGIRTLEHWVGTELFWRGPRGLTLTEAGVAYAEEVRHALSILSSATQNLLGGRQTGMLSISVPGPFANRWLIPRIARFTRRYPDIQVSIQTANLTARSLPDRTDLAIRISQAPKPGEIWTELMHQALVPVCSPMLVKDAGHASAMDLIRRLPHIEVASEDEGWPAWFYAKGLEPVESDSAIAMDSVELALQAAMHGLGIAIGHHPLVDDCLAGGQLVAIAGPAVALANRHWLVGSSASHGKPEIKLFRTWILQEAHAGDGPMPWTGDISFHPGKSTVLSRAGAAAKPGASSRLPDMLPISSSISPAAKANSRPRDLVRVGPDLT